MANAPSLSADDIESLKKQADHAKSMLDIIDEEIGADPSLLTNADYMSARRMYSAEWRACLDMVRKSGKPAAEEPKKGKLAAIRGNVVKMTG